jgi:glycosyltransferase involved in cell wall biosynthesis
MTLVSVIVPVYNGSEFLLEAITSIQGQTYRPLEIIVVDDGSTDSTPQLIAALGSEIRSIRQDNAGPSAARNAGLRLVHGEVIAFLDADDLWPPDKLSTQVQYLRDHPHIDMVMGGIQPVELPGAIHRDFRFDIQQEAPVSVNLGGALFRSSVFDRVGMFDESMLYSEDVDLFMRIREQGVPLAILDTVTLYYRLHAHNMTNKTAAMDSYLLRAFKKSLDRRRRAHGEARNLPSFES